MPFINQNKSFKALKLTNEICAIKYNYISVPSSTLQLVIKCVLCLHVGMVTLLNMYPGNTSLELHYVICMYIRCIFKLCFWLACSESWQDSDNPATNEIHLINWSLANVTTHRHSGTLLVCSIQLCSILFTEGGIPENSPHCNAQRNGK